RKNVAVMLKDVEKNRAAKKEKPTMRRRLEQAGFPKASPRSFWMLCGIVALVAAGAAILFHQKPLVIVLVVFAAGLPGGAPEEEIHRELRQRHRRHRAFGQVRSSHQ